MTAPAPELGEFSRWERALWPALDLIGFASHPGDALMEARLWWASRKNRSQTPVREAPSLGRR